MNIRYLEIPTEPAWTFIPFGMCESDFQMVLKAIELWREKICPLEQGNKNENENKGTVT